MRPSSTAGTRIPIGDLQLWSILVVKVFIAVNALAEGSESESFAQELLHLDHGCRIDLMLTSRSDVSLDRLTLPLATFRLYLENLEQNDIRDYVDGDMKKSNTLEKP